MRVIVFFMGIFLIVSCQSETSDSSTKSVAELEMAYEKNPVKENMTALVNAYQADTTGKYQLKLAELQIENNFMGDGITTLKNRLGRKASFEEVLLLAKAYEKANPPIANVIYQIIGTAFPNKANEPSVKEAMADAIDLNENMEQLYKRTYSDSLQRILPDRAKTYIETSEIYTILLSESDKSPLYLKRSGELARTILQFDKAIELYDSVIVNYPDSEEAETVLFLSAFTFENDLDNADEARKRYEQFLQKYPDSDFADDVQFLLNNLGKDDAAILEALQQK